MIPDEMMHLQQGEPLCAPNGSLRSDVAQMLSQKLRAEM